MSEFHRIVRARVSAGLRTCLGAVASTGAVLRARMGAVFTTCFGAVLVLSLAGCRASEDRLPNFIIIFADDLGHADVGAYGAIDFETPHLDRLADEGIRFTQFYVPASACSPSRAALLTGRYPLRVGLPNVLGPRSRVGINPTETTLAELLKEKGYATAAVGKWHLGDHPKFLPTNHGFDSYFGIPYSNDMSPVVANNPRDRARNHPLLPLIRDTTVVEREPDQSRLTRRYTYESLAFIREHADKPFFLYLAHTFVHVPLYASESFLGSSERGLFGDVMQELDWSVGEIVRELGDLGIAENTLVAFTSDNGPWLVMGNHAGSAYPFREGKATSFEGGHRVPGILWWPDRIPSGTVSGEVVTSMDLLPTVAHLAGVTIPDSIKLDGFDIWPILSQQPGAVSPYDRFYYYRGGRLQGVRSGHWKLHVPHRYATLDGGKVGADGMPGTYASKEIDIALFDLEADPSERTDVASAHPDVVDRLLALIEEARMTIGDRQTGALGSEARGPGRVDSPWHVQVGN